LRKHPTGLSYKGRTLGYSNACTGLLSLVQAAITVCLVVSYIQGNLLKESWIATFKSYDESGNSTISQDSLKYMMEHTPSNHSLLMYQASSVELARKKCYCNATVTLYDSKNSNITLTKNATFTLTAT
jgi:hypothetical protein